MTDNWCRGSLSTETSKRRREEVERDTATSGEMPPPSLANEDNRRGSRVGSVNATFWPRLREDRDVASLDQEGMLPRRAAPILII